MKPLAQTHQSRRQTGLRLQLALPVVALAIAVVLAFYLTPRFQAGGIFGGGNSRPSDRPPSRISTLISHMTLGEKVGQLLMVGFDGTNLSTETKQMLSRYHPGGIILFSDNFQSPPQLKSLDAALQAHSHVPLLVSVDQEGGEVIRITSGVKQLPSEQAYGQTSRPSVVRQDAQTEAVGLTRLGINMNLAPVLDVASDPNSIMASEQRSYGPNASRDAKLGAAAIQGYQSKGIAATAKHVVGLGTTSVDPETTLPTLNLTTSQLTTQFLPFKKAVSVGVDAIMTTHVIVPGLTSAHTPASLSRKVITGVIRKQWGFKGVTITDSLSMGAVTSHFSMQRAVIMALNAGEDILLMAGNGGTPTGVIQSAKTSIVADVRNGSMPISRVNSAVRHILELKQKLNLSIPAK